MILNVFQTKISISVPFAVLIAFLLLMDTTGMMSASLIAIVVHEFGHLIAMKKFGCFPKEIRLCLGGMLIVGNRFCDFLESIVVSISGPLANILVFGLFWLLGEHFNSMSMLVLATVQFLVGVVNLCPVKGLDGGYVLKNLLLNLNVKNALLVYTCVSFLFACAMFVVGIAVCVKNVSNPSLLLLGIYLIMLNISRIFNGLD